MEADSDDGWEPSVFSLDDTGAPESPLECAPPQCLSTRRPRSPPPLPTSPLVSPHPKRGTVSSSASPSALDAPLPDFSHSALAALARSGSPPISAWQHLLVGNRRVPPSGQHARSPQMLPTSPPAAQQQTQQQHHLSPGSLADADAPTSRSALGSSGPVVILASPPTSVHRTHQQQPSSPLARSAPVYGSSWSDDDDDDDDDDAAAANRKAAADSSAPIPRTEAPPPTSPRVGSSPATAPTLSPSSPVKSFVGSFEESLLSARMSATPYFILRGFGAILGVVGRDPSQSTRRPAHGTHTSSPSSTAVVRRRSADDRKDDDEADAAPTDDVGGDSARDPTAPSSSMAPLVADSLAAAASAPAQYRTSFEALYFRIESAPDAPYVATIPLDRRGYAVPPSGVVQLTITNPARTPLKTFLISYNLIAMPPRTKAYLRQRTLWYKHGPARPPVLVYAVALRFSSPRAKHLVLAKHIKVVFSHRLPDNPSELEVVYDDPQFFPYSQQ